MADFTLTWLVLAVYFVMLFAILLNVKMQHRKEDRQSDEKKVDKVEQHYLASVGMQGFTMGMTCIASIFSGYTVTGLPAEAYRSGFGYLRWLGIGPPLVFMYIIICPRLSYLARKRGYISVLDVVRDRYSKGPVFPGRGGFDLVGALIHWIATVTFMIPCIIYLLVQFISFGSNLSTLSEGDMDLKWSTFLLFILIVTFDTVGGLKAVAHTDVIQGCVLLIGTILFVFVQGGVFGGMESASEALPEITKTVPDTTALGGWLSYGILVGAGRIVFPDIPSRILSTKTQARGRVSALIILAVNMFIYIIIGMIGIQGYAEFGPDVNPRTIFIKVCMRIAEENFFGELYAALFIAGSTAAIMSTSDSVLMETAKLMTFDVIKPIFEGCGIYLTSNTLVWVGRFISIGIGLLCWILVGFEVVKFTDLSEMLGLQNVFTMAIAPLYIFGLYSDSTPAWLALVSLVFGVGCGVPVWVYKVNLKTLSGSFLPGAPLIVVAANFLMVFVGSCLIKWRYTKKSSNYWDGWLVALEGRDFRRDERLRTHSMNVVERIALPRPSVAPLDAPGAPSKEPVNYWQICLAFIVAVVLSYPWGGGDERSSYGIPGWAVVLLCRMLGLCFVLGLLIMFGWGENKPEDQSPNVDDTDKTTQKGLVGKKAQNGIQMPPMVTSVTIATTSTPKQVSHDITVLRHDL